VLSLREIAGDHVAVQDLREDIVRNFQHERPIEDLSEDDLDAAGSESFAAEAKDAIAAEQDSEAAEGELKEGDFSFAEENLDVND